MEKTIAEELLEFAKAYRDGLREMSEALRKASEEM